MKPGFRSLAQAIGRLPGKRKPRVAGLSWAGQDSNLRSSDYELRVRRGALFC